jgi:hypothetical protein
MKQEAILIRARLKPPRVAAVAGTLFSVLLITGLLLFRIDWVLLLFPLWVLLRTQMPRFDNIIQRL